MKTRLAELRLRVTVGSLVIDKAQCVSVVESNLDAIYMDLRSCDFRRTVIGGHTALGKFNETH